jgi:hypothetical protein
MKFHYDTQCDGEAIIHLYIHGGIEFCAKQLDGEFAFCLVDTLKRRVFLGRDTYGIKPMFKIMALKGFEIIVNLLLFAIYHFRGYYLTTKFRFPPISITIYMY